MCGVAGVAVLLVVGFGPVPAGIALALLMVALLGSRRIAVAVGAAGVAALAGAAALAGIARRSATGPIALPRHPLPL